MLLFYVSYCGFPCRYNDAFEGVVLAYSVETPDKRAKILSGIHPYFGVRLQAKLLLFSPKPGMLLGSLLFASLYCLFYLVYMALGKLISLIIS